MTIEDAYWAVQGGLLAGPRPSGDHARVRASVARLVEAGIRTVIDLRAPSEPPSIRALLDKLCGEAAWIGVPILDGGAPSIGTMQAILDAIDASIARARPVYVHCEGGRGRTGTVVACHWIRHGLFDPEAALAELARRRQGLPSGHRPSPETGAQRALVRAWTRGL